MSNSRPAHLRQAVIDSEQLKWLLKTFLFKRWDHGLTEYLQHNRSTNSISTQLTCSVDILDDIAEVLIAVGAWVTVERCASCSFITLRLCQCGCCCWWWWCVLVISLPICHVRLCCRALIKSALVWSCLRLATSCTHIRWCRTSHIAALVDQQATIHTVWTQSAANKHWRRQKPLQSEASISLHGWGDTQWPINPHPTTVLLSCDVLLRTTYLLYGMKS